MTGAFSGAEAIAAVPVQADGRVFRLGDIATVKRGYEDPPSFLVREGGKPALGIGVSMQDGGNILALGEDLKKAMKAITAELPVGIEITQVADQPHIVDESVSEFLKTFVEALGIVLLVSFLTLGWRTGIVVALSVPLVLAIVFIVMYAGGLDLHRITLGALIIALGLAGRRRHHRHRDDGGEDGAGLRPRARRDLRLDLDRVPDADRHAGDGRGLPAGRLRQFEHRRICRRHLLGRRPGADRLLVRGGAVHALSRREAPAGFRQEHADARPPVTRITIRRRSTTRASIARCGA